MKDVAVKRWVLEGTDYVYPRTTNKILEAYLKSKGVAAADISINYTPFGHSDWQTRVAAIKRFGSAGKKTAVVSTINGDANVPFYKELGNQKISAEDIPVVAFSVGEEELSGLDTKPLVGHLAAWNYFQSVKTPANDAFIKQWKTYIKKPNRTTNDPMEAHYIGFNLWVKAVEKAKSTDVEAVLAALPGLETPNLTGGIAKMLPNHQITKPVYIGEVRADGQFEVVWKTAGTVPGDAWSDYLPVSKDTEADWVTLKCGNYNTKTNNPYKTSHHPNYTPLNKVDDDMIKKVGTRGSDQAGRDTFLRAEDDQTILSLSAPVFYRWPEAGPFDFYGGGGIALGFVDRDEEAGPGEDDGLEFVIAPMLAAGLAWPVGESEAGVELAVTANELQNVKLTDDVTTSGGARFKIGFPPALAASAEDLRPAA